jgi:hypothetical protein
MIVAVFRLCHCTARATGLPQVRAPGCRPRRVRDLRALQRDREAHRRDRFAEQTTHQPAVTPHAPSAKEQPVMTEERTEQLVSPEGWRIWDSDGNWLGDAIMRPGDAEARPQWLPITPVSSPLRFQETRAAAIGALRRWRNAARAKARKVEFESLPPASISLNHNPGVDGLPSYGKPCFVYGCGRPTAIHDGTLVHVEEIP